jgi:hypothetical protein
MASSLIGDLTGVPMIRRASVLAAVVSFRQINSSNEIMNNNQA